VRERVPQRSHGPGPYRDPPGPGGGGRRQAYAPDMPLKIGYKASAEQFAPRELLDYAVLAEEVGLDSVMISDHYQPWRHHGGHAPFSLAWLGAGGEGPGRGHPGPPVGTP